MSFSRTTEAGTYETPATTIGAMIQREWDTTNPLISDGLGGANGSGANVKFLYDQTTRDTTNVTAMMEAIVFNDGDSFNIPERTGLGLGLVGMGDQVFIDVFGGNQQLRKLYEFEIYRILRKLRPIAESAFVPIKKSNNTDNSPIHDYDEAMPQFIAFEDGKNGRELTAKSSAVLTVLSEWEFTP